MRVRLRRHSRGDSAAQEPGQEPAPRDPAQVERDLYELVREGMLKTLGAGGTWTVSFRRSDSDAFFSETVAEAIARDITARILAADAKAPEVALETALAAEETPAAANPPAVEGTAPARASVSPERWHMVQQAEETETDPARLVA
ncbi:MAG TPA: hypothetical protein VGC18_03515 [Lacisediminihabitans sp.]|uniref:hypothetical protein n=1 Tax=Lacisediminihabitans sp. TaxID=2787631 RepID=UPI002ED82E5C